MKRQRCHVGAKGNLLGRSIQEISASLSCVSERCVGLLAGRVSPVSVGVVVIQVVVHCFDHLTRYLSSAGSIKISNGLVVVYARERGKTGADVESRSYRHYCLNRSLGLDCHSNIQLPIWLTDLILTFSHRSHWRQLGRNLTERFGD